MSYVRKEIKSIPRIPMNFVKCSDCLHFRIKEVEGQKPLYWCVKHRYVGSVYTAPRKCPDFENIWEDKPC